jgi:hypothetical protein
MTCASRIRKAIQYSSTIDKAVEILLKENNGLYTNEWMLADINTNEIAVFELGTHKHKLWRSSKNEWFGDTPGFYWGCNNAKDLDVRLETIPSAQGKPANVVYKPDKRDMAWQKFYREDKGKIGVEFGKKVFTSPSLALVNQSLDAKFTTTAMAKEMKTWALFGPPTGGTWNPTAEEKKKYPEIKALVSNPWTVLGTMAPAASVGREATVIAGPKEPKAKGKQKGAAVATANLQPAWHGTLLPQTDGDIWLAIAFADYERLVSTERAAVKRGDSAKAARDALEKSIAAVRKNFQKANTKLSVALADLKANPATDDWYSVAATKGVLLLHELRSDVGDDAFDKAMDQFGKEFGGQRVTSKQFQAHIEKATGRKLEAFFETWLKGKGLPNAKKTQAAWSQWGVLRNSDFMLDGKRTFRLEDQQGKLLYYAVADAGKKLEPYLGRNACLYGPTFHDWQQGVDYVVMTQLSTQ